MKCNRSLKTAVSYAIRPIFINPCHGFMTEPSPFTFHFLGQWACWPAAPLSWIQIDLDNSVTILILLLQSHCKNGAIATKPFKNLLKKMLESYTNKIGYICIYIYMQQAKYHDLESNWSNDWSCCYLIMDIFFS